MTSRSTPQAAPTLPGDTCSPDFPTVNPFQASLSGPLPNCDAFVTKLSPAGDALVYSTFLGGICGDTGFGIAVDATGNAYVAGETGSVIPINETCAAANFPVVNGFQSTHGGIMDAFVAKLDPTGSRLLYSTYLGGRGDDGASGIALDGAGNVYVGGTTSSANFPTVHPFQACGMGDEDGFVAKVSPGGDALVYSTCLGGGCLDQIHAIAIDSSGHAYATGETCSSDYPTLNAFQNVLRAPSRDGFVTKLSLAGDSLVYSTFLGGSALDTAVRDCGGPVWQRIHYRPDVLGGLPDRQPDSTHAGGLARRCFHRESVSRGERPHLLDLHRWHR